MTPRWLPLAVVLLAAVSPGARGNATDLPFDVRLGENEASLEVPVGVDEAWDLLLSSLEPLADGQGLGRPESGWITVADVWAVAEPVPYLEGRWSLIRVRVGSFATEAERARAVDLLHTVEALHAEREAYRAWLASTSAASAPVAAESPQVVYVSQPVQYVYPTPLWCSPWLWYGPTFYHLGGYACGGYGGSYVSFGFGSGNWWVGLGHHYFPHIYYPHGLYAGYHGYHHGYSSGCWYGDGHGHHGGHHGGDQDVDVTVIVEVPDGGPDGGGGKGGGGDDPGPGGKPGLKKIAGLTGRIELDNVLLNRRSPGSGSQSGTSVHLPSLTLTPATPWSTRNRGANSRTTSGPLVVSTSGRTTTISRVGESGLGSRGGSTGIFSATSPFSEPTSTRSAPSWTRSTPTVSPRTTTRTPTRSITLDPRSIFGSRSPVGRAPTGTRSAPAPKLSTPSARSLTRPAAPGSSARRATSGRSSAGSVGRSASRSSSRTSGRSSGRSSGKSSRKSSRGRNG